MFSLVYNHQGWGVATLCKPGELSLIVCLGKPKTFWTNCCRAKHISVKLFLEYKSLEPQCCSCLKKSGSAPRMSESIQPNTHNVQWHCCSSTNDGKQHDPLHPKTPLWTCVYRLSRSSASFFFPPFSGGRVLLFAICNLTARCHWILQSYNF